MTLRARTRCTTGFLVALCITINAGLNIVLRNAGPIPGTLVSAATVLTIAWLITEHRTGTTKTS